MRNTRGCPERGSILATFSGACRRRTPSGWIGIGGQHRKGLGEARLHVSSDRHAVLGVRHRHAPRRWKKKRRSSSTRWRQMPHSRKESTAPTTPLTKVHFPSRAPWSEMTWLRYTPMWSDMWPDMWLDMCSDMWSDSPGLV